MMRRVSSIAVLLTAALLVSQTSEVSCAFGFSSSGSDSGKVLLRDVQVESTFLG